MAKNDFQYAGWSRWNSYTLQCRTITTFISSGDCTLQCGMWLWNRDSEFTKWQHPALCDTWLWDEMPLNSPKRPLYWNSTYGFHFHTSPQSTCHSIPVCEIYPNRTTLGHVDFQDGGSQPSWIVGIQ